MPSLRDPATLARTSDRRFFLFNALVSATAVAVIAFVLLRGGSHDGHLDLSFVPPINALLNALSALCLALGWLAIRRRAVTVHRMYMVSAFAFSCLFLVGYLSYHFVHGDTKFLGTGPIRSVYFSVLISHVVLSLGIVPLALTSFYFAFTGAFARHRRLNRVFLPMWLYVSVTGVVIFFLLRP